MAFLPFDSPVVCRRCGHLAERRWLVRPEYTRLALRGIRHRAPGDCEPDEYETVCPACGAVESFEEAIRCAECRERPCVCEGNGNEP